VLRREDCSVERFAQDRRGSVTPTRPQTRSDLVAAVAEMRHLRGGHQRRHARVPRTGARARNTTLGVEPTLAIPGSALDARAPIPRAGRVIGESGHSLPTTDTALARAGGSAPRAGGLPGTAVEILARPDHARPSTEADPRAPRCVPWLGGGGRTPIDLMDQVLDACEADVECVDGGMQRAEEFVLAFSHVSSCPGLPGPLGVDASIQFTANRCIANERQSCQPVVSACSPDRNVVNRKGGTAAPVQAKSVCGASLSGISSGMSPTDGFQEWRE
jgi:hypothetical protein